MAQILTMCMYAIFLALNYMGHAALFTEGRKMKSMNKVESSRPIKIADATEMMIGVHGIQYINSHHHSKVVIVGKKEDAPPTTPGQIPDVPEHSVAGKKDIFTPSKHAISSPGSSQTFLKFEKNNKPAGTLGGGTSTTLGNAHYTENKSTLQDHSPGVGHSFVLVESDEHVKPGVVVDSSTGEERYTKDGGHSPGVGHPFVESSSIKDSKRDVRGVNDGLPHDYSPGVGHSFVDYSEDKNTPKVQGHSPGVGHSLKNKNAAEPNA